MNKTSKLFCAAILLLSVACKDAPMTEPSPYQGLEFVYQKQGKKYLVGLQDSTGNQVIPILYDSIRPGFVNNFLLAWLKGRAVLYAKDRKSSLADGYRLIGKVGRIGTNGLYGSFYRVHRSKGDICVYETDSDIETAIKRYQVNDLVILEAETDEIFRLNPNPQSSDSQNLGKA